MLRAKQIGVVLSQANSEGVHCSMLLQSDGALLGSAGDCAPDTSDRIIGAITTNIWQDFIHLNNTSGKMGELRMMMLELEEARLGVVGCGEDCLVCCYADKSVKFGLIKAKLDALSRYFGDALSNLTVKPPHTS